MADANGAGASLTYPAQASACRKGGFLMIKDRACKIVDMSTSKTGKHGHAKCKFMALDIFDGSKHEMIESSTHNVNIPNVTRTEYTLTFIDEDDGALTLLDMNSGAEKTDVKLPKDQELADKIKEAFDKSQDDGSEVIVTLLCAIGKEEVIDLKTIADK